MRTASCSCGQLSIACAGEPVRISMCHCLACQKRTGSAFAVQARFPRSAVSASGESSLFQRTGDSGTTATFHFCPACGATVFWDMDAFPDFVAVAVGAFADPSFPAPKVSVYEERKHSWVLGPGGQEIEHPD